MALQFPLNTFVSGASLDPQVSDPLNLSVDVFTDSACTTPATVTDVYSGGVLATLAITNGYLQYFNGPDDTTTTLYIRATDSTGAGTVVVAEPVLHSLMTLNDFKKRYDVTDDDQAQVGLDDGSSLIREATLNPFAWPQAPGGVPRAIQVILSRAVARWLNNPDGLQSESFGSYSYAYSKDSAEGIWLTDGEVKQIQKLYNGGRPTSVRVGSPYTCGPFDNTVYSNVGDPSVDSRWGGAIPFFDPFDLELVDRWVYDE